MATTAKGYHYPVGTDRLADGDNVLQSLATDVDTWLGKAVTGLATVTVATANVPVSVAVTFPAGFFSGTPAVVTTPQATNPKTIFVSAQNMAATGFLMWGTRNSSGNVTGAYYAVQV